MIDYKIKLWAHQARDIPIAAKLPAYGFFYEQGTGKTAAAINTLRYKYAIAKRHMRTLIIVPPNVLYNWVEEFEKNSKLSARVVVLYGSQKKRRVQLEKALQRKQNIHITPYTSLHMADLVEDFKKVGYECFVADEAHRFRNRKAKQTKAAIKLVDGDPKRNRDPIAHRLALTGSPVLNNGGLDLWAIFRILDGGKLLGDNFFAFRNIYYTDNNARWAAKPGYFPDYVPKPTTEKMLNKVVYKIASRVLKKDCLDLPELTRTRLRVDLSWEQQRHYKEMERDLIAYIKKVAVGKSAVAVAQLALTQSLRLRQMVTGFVTLDDGSMHVYEKNPRADALRETLEDLAPVHKVIVWACFQQNYEVIRNVCRSLNLEYTEINGSVPDAREKRKNELKFKNDPNCRVMIANQQSGGEGMNMQAASYAIYYSRSHSLLENEQSEARNHRGGSEIHEKITRLDLVTPGTIDEDILTALAEHKSVAEAILALAKK